MTPITRQPSDSRWLRLRPVLHDESAAPQVGHQLAVALVVIAVLIVIAALIV